MSYGVELSLYTGRSQKENISQGEEREWERERERGRKKGRERNGEGERHGDKGNPLHLAFNWLDWGDIGSTVYRVTSCN